MRCHKEEFIEGATFHLYNRAPDDTELFKHDDDYEYFLQKLSKNIIKYGCDVNAYCLMPNHFHFCMTQRSEKPLYRVLNDSFTSYALYFNHKYARKGHIFQGKLQHKRVIEDRYVYELCRYIHLNPVRAGLVKAPEEWKYSNYYNLVKGKASMLLSQNFIDLVNEGFDSYAEFVNDYVKDEEEQRRFF